MARVSIGEMRRITGIVVPAVLAVFAMVTVTACSDGDDADEAEGPASASSGTVGEEAFTFTSPAFDEGDPLPDQAALGAENLSPPLVWSGVPAGADQLAITVVDPDAANFVHWVLWGIDPVNGSLEEGAVPDGAVVGLNQFGEPGWGGPQPPAGEEHTYRFTVHALEADPGIAPDTPAVEALAAVEAVTDGRAELRGQFETG